MTRAYIRKDPGFFERKAITQAYPAGAYVALDGVFCLAESQAHRGRFRDRRLLRALLGQYGRWVPFLIEKGDLVEFSGGQIYVEGWDEWQEGDWKVGERVQRIRTRKTVTPTVTSTVTSTVTDRRARESRPAIAKPLTATEGVQGEPDDPVVALHERTGTFPSGKILEWVNELGATHGEVRVADAFRTTQMAGSDIRIYLRAVRDRLRAEDHEADRLERVDERRRLSEKRAPVSPVVAALRDALRAKEATA